MEAELSRHTISERAIRGMRALRRNMGWTAQQLAERCDEVAATMEPPMISTLKRPRISKLESGIAEQLTADELWIGSTALGVSIDFLVSTHFDEGKVPPSLENRLLGMEDRLHTLEDALRQAGIELPGVQD
jgi:transcriptional regulator with XRE-family HTH domain